MKRAEVSGQPRSCDGMTGLDSFSSHSIGLCIRRCTAGRVLGLDWENMSRSPSRAYVIFGGHLERTRSLGPARVRMRFDGRTLTKYISEKAITMKQQAKRAKIQQGLGRMATLSLQRLSTQCPRPTVKSEEGSFEVLLHESFEGVPYHPEMEICPRARGCCEGEERLETAWEQWDGNGGRRERHLPVTKDVN